MKLREWDYGKGPSGDFVEVEYPDEIIKGFIDYLRLTKAWREDPEIVFARWMVVERELIDFHNQSKQPVEAKQFVDRCTSLTKAGDPCRITHGLEDGLCHIHRPYRALVPA